MCNAIFKYIFAALLVLALLLVACTEKQENNSVSPAEDLYAQAEMLIDSNPDSAMVIIDSLCRAYKSELEVVDKAITLQTIAIQKQCEIGLAWADSVIAATEPVVNRLKPMFVSRQPKDIVEPYFIYKPIAGRELVNITAIQPRIDQIGKPYLVDLLHGVSAKHTHLIARCGGSEAATTPVAPDKATNYRFSDNGTPNEMITFHPENCEDFFKFVAANAGKDIKITFAGGKNHTIPLSKADKEAIANTWTYANASNQLRSAQGRKVYCTEKAKIAKKQQELRKFKKNQ